MTSILLVDDHPVVREGLRGMLTAEPDLVVCGEADSGAAAVALAEETRPDVILMDLRMPGGDGVTAIEQILACVPTTRIVVVTTFETDTDILRAVAAGATGYLLKDFLSTELTAAVRAAARGETVLAPAVVERLAHRLRRPSLPTLSARETQVLAYVATGMTIVLPGAAEPLSRRCC